MSSMILISRHPRASRSAAAPGWPRRAWWPRGTRRPQRPRAGPTWRPSGVRLRSRSSRLDARRGHRRRRPADKAQIAKQSREDPQADRAQQKEIDTAMGGGPGVKLVRKAASGGAAPGGVLAAVARVRHGQLVGEIIARGRRPSRITSTS
jgi:hypothetical protein